MTYNFRIWSKVYNCYINPKQFTIDLMSLGKLNSDFSFQMMTNTFDRVGTPIYEGDIIKIHNNSEAIKKEYWFPVYKIVFDGWKFSCIQLHGILGCNDEFSIRHWYSRSEIIGNIFENEELLKTFHTQDPK